MPPEFLSNIKRLRDTTPSQLQGRPDDTPTPLPKSYGIDGAITHIRNNSTLCRHAPWRSVIYAFDVSGIAARDAAAPALLWKGGCPNLGRDRGGRLHAQPALERHRSDLVGAEDREGGRLCRHGADADGDLRRRLRHVRGRTIRLPTPARRAQGQGCVPASMHTDGDTSSRRLRGTGSRDHRSTCRGYRRATGWRSTPMSPTSAVMSIGCCGATAGWPIGRSTSVDARMAGGESPGSRRLGVTTLRTVRRTGSSCSCRRRRAAGPGQRHVPPAAGLRRS